MSGAVLLVNPNDPPPRAWAPLRHIKNRTHHANGAPCSEYESDYYDVTVTRHPDGSRAVLMIVNADQSARRDWREWQRIKDDLLGPTWWGYEVYPPRDQINDPSNAFFMWCYRERQHHQDDDFAHHRICTPEQAIAPQRAFAEGGGA